MLPPKTLRLQYRHGPKRLPPAARHLTRDCLQHASLAGSAQPMSTQRVLWLSGLHLYNMWLCVLLRIQEQHSVVPAACGRGGSHALFVQEQQHSAERNSLQGSPVPFWPPMSIAPKPPSVFKVSSPVDKSISGRSRTPAATQCPTDV